MEQLLFLKALLNVVKAGISLAGAIVKFRQRKKSSPPSTEKD